MKTQHQTTTSLISRRCGAASVELAIILPVLLTVILGCIDFGRLSQTHIAVTNAARAGSGFASMHPFTSTTQAAWENQLRQAIADEMSDFDANQIQVSATKTHDPNALWRVRVVVTYPFETTVNWPFIPNQLDLQRAVEIRGIR